MRVPWIGVDFDGTLAIDEQGPWNEGPPGNPVPEMVKRVQDWLAQGIEVRVFTARVSSMYADATAQRLLIASWTKEHIGQMLQCTAEKDGDMLELWDDRAVQVEINTGRRIGNHIRKKRHA